MAFLVIFWIALSVGIGFLANKKGHNPVSYGVLSFFISPLIAGVMVLSLPDLKQQKKDQEALIERRKKEREVYTSDWIKSFGEVFIRYDCPLGETPWIRCKFCNSKIDSGEKVVSEYNSFSCPNSHHFISNGPFTFYCKPFDEITPEEFVSLAQKVKSDVKQKLIVSDVNSEKAVEERRIKISKLQDQVKVDGEGDEDDDLRSILNKYQEELSSLEKVRENLLTVKNISHELSDVFKKEASRVIKQLNNQIGRINEDLEKRNQEAQEIKNEIDNKKVALDSKAVQLRNEIKIIKDQGRNKLLTLQEALDTDDYEKQKAKIEKEIQECEPAIRMKLANEEISELEQRKASCDNTAARLQVKTNDLNQTINLLKGIL